MDAETILKSDDVFFTFVQRLKVDGEEAAKQYLMGLGASEDEFRQILATNEFSYDVEPEEIPLTDQELDEISGGAIAAYTKKKVCSEKCKVLAGKKTCRNVCQTVRVTVVDPMLKALSKPVSKG